MKFIKYFIFLLLAIPVAVIAQPSGSWPVSYGSSAPSYTPSSSGTRLYFNTATNELYTWQPSPTSSWIKYPKAFDQISGCAAPAYTPTARQSTFAVNSCTPKPELYQYTGSSWACINCYTDYVAGTGIDITGSTISNTGDLSSTNELNTSFSVSGSNLALTDAGGTINVPVSSIAPVQAVSAGTGISISGTTTRAITNTGDLSATNEIQTLSLSGSDLSLSLGGGTVMLPGAAYLYNNGDCDPPGIVPDDQLGPFIAWNQDCEKQWTWNGSAWVLSGSPSGSFFTSSEFTGDGQISTPLTLAQQGAMPGQVLGWNGSQWAPGTDSGVDTLFSYIELRAYVGTSKSVFLNKKGISGNFSQIESGTDNGGTIIVGSDSRVWKRDYNNVSINVLWFEAKGDGTGDDRQEIQAAINSASGLGQSVYFPSGTYRIASTFVNHTGLMLNTGIVVPTTYQACISVPSSTIIYGASLDSVVIKNESGVGAQMFLLKYANGVSISDIGIDMNYYIGNQAFVLDTCNGVSITGVKTLNTGHSVFAGISTNLNISNCNFEYDKIVNSPNGHIIEFQGVIDSRIDNNFLSGDGADFSTVSTWGQGIELWTTFDDRNNINIKIQNNTIKYMRTGIGCQACINSLIENNTIDSTGNQSMHFIASELGLNVTPSYNVIVSGNTISNFGSLVDGGDGIYLSESNEYIQIANNNISKSLTANGGRGYGINIQTPASKSIDIVSNLIHDVHASGIFVASGKLVNVKTNTIINPSAANNQDGINFSNCDSCYVSDNTIIDNRSTKLTNYGVHIQAASDYCQIVNNIAYVKLNGVFSLARGTNRYFGNSDTYGELTQIVSSGNLAGTAVGGGSDFGRDDTPAEGTIRGSTTTDQFEGYWNSSWRKFVEGTGTTNAVAKFTSAKAIGNSQITDNATQVKIGSGTALSTAKTEIIGSASGAEFQGLTITNTASVSAGAAAAVIFKTHSGFIEGFNAAKIAAVSESGANNTALVFYVYNGSSPFTGVEKMRLTSGGALGIGITPNASAIIDASSTTKGFLPPRMTTAQRDAISSPATGLMIYCTDATATDSSAGVLQVWNGSAWKNAW